MFVNIVLYELIIMMMQILQRRKAAGLPQSCALPNHSDVSAFKPGAYNLAQSFHAVTNAQKITLDALYQRYIKSVGLSARVFVLYVFTVAITGTVFCCLYQKTDIKWSKLFGEDRIESVEQSGLLSNTVFLESIRVSSSSKTSILSAAFAALLCTAHPDRQTDRRLNYRLQ